MRHKVFGKKFSRTTKQRKALFLGLSKTLIEGGEVTTTLSKAKVIRSFFEKLLTTAKKGDLASRRQVHKVLREVSLVNKLVSEIAPVFSKRSGGYLRIIKLGPRRGDAAPMAKVVFVEKVERTEKPKTLSEVKEKKLEGKSKVVKKDKKNEKAK